MEGRLARGELIDEDSRRRKQVGVFYILIHKSKRCLCMLLLAVWFIICHFLVVPAGRAFLNGFFTSLNMSEIFDLILLMIFIGD
jgi:hypothetical protein